MSSHSISGRTLLAAAAVLALLAVALALWTQHAMDMQPCPWCVLQRLEFVAIAVAAAPAWVWRSRGGLLTSAALVIALANLGALSALWQHFVAAASASCKLTLADRIISGLQLDSVLPAVFAATASCADAKATLLGVPYEFWSLAVFVVIAALAAAAVMRRAGR